MIFFIHSADSRGSFCSDRLLEGKKRRRVTDGRCLTTFNHPIHYLLIHPERRLDQPDNLENIARHAGQRN